MLIVKLRRFDYRKDLKKLYHYMLDEKNQMMFSSGFQLHNIEMFESWITEKFVQNKYHDFFMIENKDGNSIGFTFSYEFFNYDAHCKYTLCLFEEYQDTGYGAVAGIMMMDYLFRNYPLKRIFISVFDYNATSLEINKKGGFEEVGVLPDYRYWGGGYYSLHVLTITRTKFYSKYQYAIDKMKKLNKEQ